MTFMLSDSTSRAPTEREWKCSNNEERNETTALQPNHSFLTFAAPITLGLSCQKSDLLWHNILITPKRGITILWTVGKGKNLMRKLVDNMQMDVICTRTIMKFDALGFCLLGWRRNAFDYTVKTMRSNRSRFLSLHICKNLSVSIISAVFNELWGHYRQFISCNLDPLCLITAVMV